MFTDDKIHFVIEGHQHTIGNKRLAAISKQREQAFDCLLALPFFEKACFLCV